MRNWLRLSFLCVGCAGWSAACVEFEADTSLPDDLPDPPDLSEPDAGGPSNAEDGGGLPDDVPVIPDGSGVSEECEEDEDCRPGLVCEEQACEPAGNSEPGAGCVISAECDEGQCVNSQCIPAGDGELNDPCQSAAECATGLRCGVVGIATQCIEEGSVDAAGDCMTSNDCLSGLACLQGTCQPVPGAPPGVPSAWQGVECDEPTEGQIRAYFEIPGAPDAEELDYFRLPFPNDVLLDGRGRVDLGDFPTPGVNSLVGVDPMKLYVDAVNGTQGWGTNPTFLFRFSGRIDFASFDDNDAIHLIDITDPANPSRAGINFRSFSGSTNYVCHNKLSIRRGHGSPLEPGHTYAAWIGSDARGANGLEIERSPNFEAMLEDSTPGNATLAAAHEKYAPFRAYMEANDIANGDVVVATVVTVGPTRDLMADLAEAVRDEPVPEATDWVRCGADPSPCPQAEEDRACGDSSPDYDEYHALVRLPIFQEGDAPYLASGGKIQTSGPVRTEEVCLSLTVPKSDMPDGGWPLVVYGHGTGGSFRSHVRDEVAGTLSSVDVPDGPAPMDADAGAPPATGPIHFAVLGYDAVQHGPRRGDSEEDPDQLFFNFLNPDAAQGNPLQGAADVISMGRFVSTLDVDVDGDSIRIDPDAIVFFGHSQGSMHGSLGLPFADEYGAAVLSGNGASLMHALLTKTQPVNIAAVVPFLIDDPDGTTLHGGDHHPALSVIQQYIDPGDPLNFAQQISRTPLEGFLPKNVFQTFGLNDSYSPPLTMQIYARAARLIEVEAHSSASSSEQLGGSAPVPAPLEATFGLDGVEYNAGVRQYGPPSGSDGHFVVFDVPAANQDMARFLGMAARGLTPAIGE